MKNEAASLMKSPSAMKCPSDIMVSLTRRIEWRGAKAPVTDEVVNRI